MSLLPTAHAGQAYGARRIDFFTVSGEVSRSEGATGRIRDDDGMDHDIRLTEHTSALAPGDNATIMRVQAGPNRRSRPVSIVNHSRQTWMRAAPDATALLARCGITRGFNWWLAVLLLALTALASVWPLLHAFLTEMNGSMMSGVPAYSVLGQLETYAPALAGWRLENALPAGLLDAIAALGFVPMDQLTEWGLALGGTVLAAIAYGARSWRLLYVPVYAGFAIMAGVILGGAGATLALVGGAVLLFLAGGLINRIRDAGRFNARVERLSEHVLRNPPQEGVRAADTAAADGAAAALAGAGAAAMLAGGADASGAASADDDQDEEAAEPASPGDDAANGEAEAGPELELPPAAADPAVAATAEASARPDEAGEAVAADASDDGDEADDTGTASTDETLAVETGSDVGESADTPPAGTPDEAVAADSSDQDDAPAGAVEPAKTGDDSDIADETGGDSPAEPTATVHEEALSDDTPPQAANAEGTEGVTVAAGESGDGDDDLPSMDAVAAAAALTAAEQTGSEEAGDDTPPVEADGEDTASATVLEEDERTMPLASPPPMPAAGESEGDGEESGSDPVTADAAAAAPEDHQTAEADDGTAGSDAAPETETVAANSEVADSDMPASPALGEVEDRVAAAVEAAGAGQQAVARPPVDDPLLDDSGHDPMLPKSQAGDTAPGAPELDVEKTDTDETETAS